MTSMVPNRELITVCRQIGGMMEAGVDILRITRVLRAQTHTPRLLEFYDQLDHDLRMGSGISDALDRAPDVFSPFAASLVRQGEARNNLAGAFLKIADFLQQEDELVPPPITPSTLPETSAPSAPVSQASPADAGAFAESLQDVLLRVLRRVLVVAALALGATALVWTAWARGLISVEWLPAALTGTAAIALGLAACWLRNPQDEPGRPPLQDQSRQESSTVGEPGAATANPATASQGLMAQQPAQNGPQRPAGLPPVPRNGAHPMGQGTVRGVNGRAAGGEADFE